MKDREDINDGLTARSSLCYSVTRQGTLFLPLSADFLFSTWFLLPGLLLKSNCQKEENCKHWVR